jgi:hypothetical protein
MRPKSRSLHSPLHQLRPFVRVMTVRRRPSDSLLKHTEHPLDSRATLDHHRRTMITDWHEVIVQQNTRPENGRLGDPTAARSATCGPFPPDQNMVGSSAWMRTDSEGPWEGSSSRPATTETRTWSDPGNFRVLDHKLCLHPSLECESQAAHF